jgi:hypothetical protein
VEKFGASGLAWRRIVEGIIVEKLWKHFVNSAPDLLGPRWVGSWPRKYLIDNTEMRTPKT